MILLLDYLSIEYIQYIRYIKIYIVYQFLKFGDPLSGVPEIRGAIL